MRILAAVALTCLLAGRAPGQSVEIVEAADLLIPKRANSEIQEGRKLRLRSDCPRAITHLQKALTLFERAAVAHYELGLCYRELEKPEEEYELTRALEISGGEEPALQLAEFYYRNARVEEASEVIRKALRQHSDSGALYGALALIHQRQENVEEARRLALIAQGMARHLPNVHLLLAKIYEQETSAEFVPQLRQFLQEETADSETRREVETYLKKTSKTGF